MGSSKFPEEHTYFKLFLLIFSKYIKRPQIFLKFSGDVWRERGPGRPQVEDLGLTEDAAGLAPLPGKARRAGIPAADAFSGVGSSATTLGEGVLCRSRLRLLQ